MKIIEMILFIIIRTIIKIIDTLITVVSSNNNGQSLNVGLR